MERKKVVHELVPLYETLFHLKAFNSTIRRLGQSALKQYEVPFVPICLTWKMMLVYFGPERLTIVENIFKLSKESIK